VAWPRRVVPCRRCSLRYPRRCSRCPGGRRPPLRKEKAGKRGNRTSKQKRRKASKLEKALNFTGRLESKNVRVDKDLALKKSGKNLWQNDAQP
jgi:hypothetical protein